MRHIVQRPFIRAFAPVLNGFRSFKGNARTCILVEPMWGISYNLFVPYASLYMLALGVDERQIGIIAAIGMGLQTFWSLAGGWITDRFGRKFTSILFDTLSWTLPTLIWAFARDFTWFLAAAMLNSLVRVVHISWSCLFIEDAEADSRVRLYAWIAVAGTLSGFFAPIAGMLVARFGLVSATRGLYGFAFLAMTAMFWIRNAFTKETAIGLIKMKESRDRSVVDALAEYVRVLKLLVRSRAAAAAFVLAVLSNIHLMVRNNFLSIVLTRGIGLPESMIAAFPPLASAVTITVYLLVIPRIKNIRGALLLSLGMNAAGNLALFLAPQGSIAAVIVGTLAVAFGMGVTGPVIDAVLANAIEDSTRATAMAIVYTLMFAISAPFGWLAGQIAASGPRLPALFGAALMIASLMTAFSVERRR